MGARALMSPAPVDGLAARNKWARRENVVAVVVVVVGVVDAVVVVVVVYTYKSAALNLSARAQ